MNLDDLDIVEKRALAQRVNNSEDVYLRVLVDDDVTLRKDAIVLLSSFWYDDYAGASNKTRVHVLRANSEQTVVCMGFAVELAPEATKTWTPKRPKEIKPALPKLRIKDGIGREIKQGDFLVLVDGESLIHAVFDGLRADTLVIFRNTKGNQKFTRRPHIRKDDNGDRWATFRESLKIDKDTNDALVLNRLANG